MKAERCVDYTSVSMQSVCPTVCLCHSEAPGRCVNSLLSLSFHIITFHFFPPPINANDTRL